jgi:hypothetical protein
LGNIHEKAPKTALHYSQKPVCLGYPATFVFIRNLGLETVGRSHKGQTVIRISL